MTDRDPPTLDYDTPPPHDPEALWVRTAQLIAYGCIPAVLLLLVAFILFADWMGWL